VSRLAALLGFLEDDPDDPFTRFALALEYVKEGQEESGLEVFESLVGDRPDYVGTYYHLAALYRRLGNIESAKKTYELGIREAVRQADRHSESELRSAQMEMEIEEP
jgi:Tfp pilus assembly protein PilF